MKTDAEVPSSLQYDMSAGVPVRCASSSALKDNPCERNYSTSERISFDRLPGIQQPSSGSDLPACLPAHMWAHGDDVIFSIKPCG